MSWYGSDLRVYHSALLYPNGGLRSPGYVVGIENIHPSVAALAKWRGLKEGHIVTHIIGYMKPTEPTSREHLIPCVSYTIFDRPVEIQEPGHLLFERCEPDNTATGGNKFALLKSVPIDLLRDPIDLLRDRLVADLANGEYSHVLVMVMGWNTDQEKALRNFNSIVGHLSDEAVEEHRHFRPLVVGVTWPSQWQVGEWSIVPDAVVRGLSFPNKKADADDIGRGVLQTLIQGSVLGARDHIEQEKTRGVGAATTLPIVLIGHSFGARALVEALADPKGAPIHFNTEDRLILLEGAFELQRLFDKEGKLAFAAGAPRITMTASTWDSAVSAAFWGSYAGDIDTFKQVCEMKAGRLSAFLARDIAGYIGCAVAKIPNRYGLQLCRKDTRTDTNFPVLDRNRPIRYYDASSMINCSEPFTGGGAHSDIFRRETARFLMQEIY